MAPQTTSKKEFSYDVAPAHDASAVQNTAPPPAEVAPDDALSLQLLRGEEFDFDPRDQSIEPASEAEVATKSAHARWLWLVAGLALIYSVYTFGAVTGEKSRRPLPMTLSGASRSATTTVKVHVAGAVNKPGVYDLPFNSRVQEAIRKAGGPTKDANLNALNLADWAQDGSKIEVPARDKPAPVATPVVIVREVPVAAPREVASAAPDSEITSSAPSSSGESGMPLAKTASGAKSSNASIEYLTANPVNLNVATQAQLEALPGVGPKMAERILAYRAENGGFKSVDDLDEVKGIGEKRMATLKPLVKVR